VQINNGIGIFYEPLSCSAISFFKLIEKVCSCCVIFTGVFESLTISSYFFLISVTSSFLLQEAQAKIMEALSVIQHTSQSKEHFVTQIDLQNLRKKLSTELKNELVDEIRSVKTTQIELQEAFLEVFVTFCQCF
jgi:hypothetical protein